MVERSFFDANVLVYTDDHDAPHKRARALGLIHEHRLRSRAVTSTQVLQEYFVAVTRKLAVPAQIARRKVEIFARFQLVMVDLELILTAIDLHRLVRLSFWDALVVRAAQKSGCSVLYTEDLQGGQRLDGLRVVNPFA